MRSLPIKGIASSDEKAPAGAFFWLKTLSLVEVCVPARLAIYPLLMANRFSTVAGEVHVLSPNESFAELARRLNALAAQGESSVGLSGGSTPKAFYAWAVAHQALSPASLKNLHWHVSDERCVPLASDDSNFGHAERGLLNPLKVPAHCRFPWPVHLPPSEAAAAYERAWQERSPQKTFDLCVLGLGDDSHIASLWPQCPWIGKKADARFVATEWPGRGWRLTISELGLSQCASIVVLVNGKAKARALKSILQDEYNPSLHPGQILRAYAPNVTWLVDAEAASLL